jgi:hypothetical protein
MKKTFGRARILKDGSVVYAKKGWEPPPDLPGFVRDKGDPWRFLPLWPPCRFRIQTQHVKKCGAISVLTVCNCKECPLRQQQVQIQNCEQCTYKESPG